MFFNHTANAAESWAASLSRSALPTARILSSPMCETSPNARYLGRSGRRGEGCLKVDRPTSQFHEHMRGPHLPGAPQVLEISNPVGGGGGGGGLQTALGTEKTGQGQGFPSSSRSSQSLPSAFLFVTNLDHSPQSCQQTSLPTAQSKTEAWRPELPPLPAARLGCLLTVGAPAPPAPSQGLSGGPDAPPPWSAASLRVLPPRLHLL